ncbi:unnamed protein product [Spodoptera exigua]|nr:unnamed protein product [Spodoptera exigua]
MSSGDMLEMNRGGISAPATDLPSELRKLKVEQACSVGSTSTLRPAAAAARRTRSARSRCFASRPITSRSILGTSSLNSISDCCVTSAASVTCHDITVLGNMAMGPNTVSPLFSLNPYVAYVSIISPASSSWLITRTVVFPSPSYAALLRTALTTGLACFSNFARAIVLANIVILWLD